VNDPYDLQRFVDAQNPMFEQVRAELRQGRKQTHWMWFIFPQIKGLGNSPTAIEFAISSREEADAYLKHPVLGPRLRECTRLVNQIEGRSVPQIFGYPDDLKFRFFDDFVRQHHLRESDLQGCVKKVLCRRTRSTHYKAALRVESDSLPESFVTTAPVRLGGSLRAHPPHHSTRLGNTFRNRMHPVGSRRCRVCL
jgi:uncharacterized protein (DUF1810 family)